MAMTIEEVSTAVEGQTLATAFLHTVEEGATRVALRERGPGDAWVERTFAEYTEDIGRVCASLRAAGVAPGDRVVLMMRNGYDFHVVDMASVFCGATPISIYNSSSPEQISYLVGHSEAKAAVVGDDGFLERFLKVRDDLPALGEIVNLATHRSELFDGHGTVDLKEAAEPITPESLATVIYTSGTTGPPKGVMITNYNVVYTCESLRLRFGPDIDPAGKRFVSYLPMAHVAERMTSHYGLAVLGYEVTSCPDPGSLAAYLRDVRPNILFGVPRVWEKLHAGVTAAIAADPEKKAQFDAAITTAVPIALDRSWGRSTPEQDATWDALQASAFLPVKQLLGLDEVEFAITGAAPIPRELLEWFRALGVPMSEVYGLSESSGPMTWTPERIKPGTVGPAIPGCEVRITDDGEVICRGGNVFPGYLNAPDKTAKTLDDGWLHTDDIGVLDDDGYLRIVDRQKELIITAGGKNISPANLEAALKLIPIIGQACAIGDQRPFVSALVVLDPEVAPAWARARKLGDLTLAELAEHPDVLVEIDRAVDEAMSKFNNAERVKKVKVLGVEWLPDSDELTPTSKLKRRCIHALYAAEIEGLYR